MRGLYSSPTRAESVALLRAWNRAMETVVSSMTLSLYDESYILEELLVVVDVNISDEVIRDH
jgi:hypothetical protein